MIDEIKIRDLLKNMVYGLDSLTINTILDSFSTSMLPLSIMLNPRL